MIKDCRENDRHIGSRRERDVRQNLRPSAEANNGSSSKAILSTVRPGPMDNSVNPSSVYMNVVPVIVRYDEHEVATYAFLDPGSSLSFAQTYGYANLWIN